ncbi:hypothetical protein [Kitasatospora purpeofusca]|uniref:hypothetical protein n=1 Tax=Kitasatospora purpeofusca TaxID=67352 RepID=UPI0022526B49|nr:hypothetical protein [Kitasatospora purpeofusca]MCX4752889.1 hypothetical protein [Kitasatospora purpeofusca]WSR32433.1 hypothetical protein OG715_16455 [Kitasatospora purpeofusca]WSR40520.1 hypothetical protein OG196_16235 [Kitasatospora purpeofusca]
MRRLGDAAHLLGVRPWEWQLLDVEETEQLHAWLDGYEKQVTEAQQAATRRR